MRASDVLIKSIRRFEGFRSKAYQDAKGVWTIGYGHTGQVNEGDSVNREEAEILLREDLRIFENYVNSLNVCHDQCRFDALTDFAYNCGIDNLRTSTLLRYVREGREEGEIRAEFMRWVFSGKRKLRGLAFRRKWEADRFFGRTTPVSLWEKLWFVLAGKMDI
jgi:lysozyme